nr:ligand-gated ion channel 50-like [Penaeus vannamei]
MGLCALQTFMYPFDSQSGVSITNMLSMFEFVKGGVFFTGERRLLEYKFVKEEMFITDDARSVKVVLHFRNQYGYYVGNAFVPSMFMVFICYLTLLFDLADFQDRIMVSLTSLLVLASLFSQTSQSIPKTAYLKHIDVWYIVLISLDFFIIVVLVVIENLRLYSEEDDRVFTMTGASGDKMAAAGGKGEKGGKLRMATVSYRALSLRLNRASVVVFPIVSTLFVLAFFMIGLVRYYVD